MAHAIQLTVMKQKILVVDDESEAVELVEFNLKQAGFEVVTAADGEEAVKGFVKAGGVRRLARVITST